MSTKGNQTPAARATPAAAFAAAFREWQRRYLNNPADFDADWSSLAHEDYGDRAAAYFERLLAETAGGL